MSLYYAIFLSVLPIFELRGGIPVAIGTGVNPFIAFVSCTFANILIIFPIFFFLDHMHNYFMKNNFYKKIFLNRIEKGRKKIGKHIGKKTEFISLLLLTAIPLPGTGAYTVSIISWFWGVKRTKAYLAISLGVLIAGIIVTLATLGFINFFL